MHFLKPVSQGSSTSRVHDHVINRRLREERVFCTDSNCIDFSAGAASRKASGTGKLKVQSILNYSHAAMLTVVAWDQSSPAFAGAFPPTGITLGKEELN